MDKHGGCFYCRGGQGEVLTSGIPKSPIVDAAGRLAGAPCVAVCSSCLDKVETIR
jgi:hypothetical protein